MVLHYTILLNIMINLIKGIIIITIAVTVVACEKYVNTKNPFSDGISKALAGNTAGATRSFIRCIKSNIKPNKCFVAIRVISKLNNQKIDSHSSYFFFSAMDKLTKGDISGAKADVDKAIFSELNFSEAQILRAIINQQLDDDISALNDFSAAITTSSDEFNFVYNERGITNSYLGNFTEAIADFDKAIQNDPNYVFAYFNRANTTSILNMHQDAIKFYTKALSIDPDFHEAFFFRANAYLELNDYKNAIKDYSGVIRIKPKFAMAYINRGPMHGCCRRG